MTKEITFTIEDDNGEEIEYSLPARFEVCDRCDGHGKYTNPNIECDGGGFTMSEWREACWEDPDFSQDYFGGVYDITCEECKGLRVVPVVDDRYLSDEQKELYKRYQEQQENEAWFAAEQAAERRMGC